MYARAYVEITNICNMHCSFCHGHTRALRRMRPEEFTRVLDQLEGKTKYLYYHLMGEPLTHPELPLFLKMAAQRGFLSVLTTNGTLLKRRGEELLAAGVHKVSISLHSFEAGGSEAREQYLRECAEFGEKAAAAGTVTVFRLWNRGWDGGANEAVVDYLRAALPGDWVENTRGYRIRKKLFLEWGDRFQWPDLEAQPQGEEVFCYGLGDHFGILCDGSVVPCCMDSEGAITLGNVFFQPLEEILESPRARAIREGFEKRRASEALCRRCGYAQRFL